VYPEMCAALSKKNKALMQLRWENWEAELVRASAEEPPPPLNAVCARLKASLDCVKRKFPSLARKIVKRAELVNAEQHRKSLIQLLPIAPTMTRTEVLRALQSTTITLSKQCPNEYRAAMMLVRNTRREAVERRRANLREFISKRVQSEIESGCTTTLSALYRDLPGDCLRARHEVSAMLQEARGKLGSPLIAVSHFAARS
jgi:hypothetical protein